MRKQLLQDDFWLKITSVVMAVVLWAVVMSDYTQESSRSFDVPLIIKPHPFFEIYEGPQDREMRVEVRAVGRNLVVSRLKSDELRAELDYGKVTEAGKSTVVDIKITGPGRAQYYVVPKTVAVTLVENRDMMAKVSVEPDTGIVAYEGREYHVTARPLHATVQVTGRSDYLMKVKKANISLDLSELVPTTERLTKQVFLLDASGVPVEKLATPYMDVELNWELLPLGKSAQVQPTTRGKLPDGYELKGFESVPSTVTMRATSLDGKLPDLDMVGTELIDLSNRTKSFTTTVRLQSPPDTYLSLETAGVTVQIQEKVIEKSFPRIPITLVGKEGEEVSLSTEAVEVRLKGLYSIITPIQQSDISATIDVRNLGRGKHRLPVKIQRPQGQIEEVIDPPIVDVTISN